MPFDAPHIRFPFKFSGTSVKQIEQDTVDEILQNIEIILRYRRGERTDNPDFGIDDQSFLMGGADLTMIWDAVDQYEDRAEILIQEDPSLLNELIDRVSVSLSEIREVDGG